jgi:4-carboxymuconolactone decarboxylase
VRGPFSILMYSPPLCECVLHSGSFLRFQSGVKPKEGELAIIATAREKDCPYVWAAHVTLARKAGVREEAITAVRERRDVSGLQPDEQAIVTYVRALGGGADRHRGPLRPRHRHAERLRGGAGSGG